MKAKDVPNRMWGYTLSSEEFGPRELVRNAVRAEAAGFRLLDRFGSLSPLDAEPGPQPVRVDHPRRGRHQHLDDPRRHRRDLPDPSLYTRPSSLRQRRRPRPSLDGRFFLGVGTGEWLNEHITGDAWPAVEVRREMLIEAVELMRRLWTGETVDFLWRVLHRRERPPFTPTRRRHPGDLRHVRPGVGDGRRRVWRRSVVDLARGGAGRGLPGRRRCRARLGQVTLCHADDAADAAKTAREIWPNAAIPGQLSQDLPTWSHFEQVAELVTVEKIAETLPCGPDVEPVLESVAKYVDAGFDHIHFHQIGSDQEGFFAFWKEQLAPALA